MIPIELTQGEILIVDDEEINHQFLKEVLAAKDYCIRITTNPLEVHSMVRNDPPDLILLDINMPQLSGFELCQLLKQDSKTQDIPVIFISGIDAPLEKVRAFELGGVDYITKPFHCEEVMARIESQLKISRLQKELERNQKELEIQNIELRQKNYELSCSQRRTNLIFNALTEALPGTVIDNKYLLEEKIGDGGFGTVYRASHLGLNRSVAVKVFRPLPGNETHEGLERFRLEGISACHLNHPNAVTVLDYGVSSAGMAYLVMELLNGQDLNDELKQTFSISSERCAEIIIPVCNLLAQAHQLGIVHRDIKPANIFLHHTEKQEVIKVVDFGTAKLLDCAYFSQECQNLTMDGSLLGTPMYMSPERIKSEPYNGQSDIYSLGVTLYQMLCGHPPFELNGRDLYSLMTQHLTQKPPSLREQNPEISPELESLVERMLNKNPLKRPTASQVEQELLWFLGYHLNPHFTYQSQAGHLNFDNEDLKTLVFVA